MRTTTGTFSHLVRVQRDVHPFHIIGWSIFFGPTIILVPCLLLLERLIHALFHLGFVFHGLAPGTFSEQLVPRLLNFGNFHSQVQPKTALTDRKDTSWIRASLYTRHSKVGRPCSTNEVPTSINVAVRSGCCELLYLCWDLEWVVMILSGLLNYLKA